VLLIGGATALIFFHARLPMVLVAGGAAALLLAMLSFGALLERRRWALPVELARLAGTAGLAAFWLVRG